MNVKDTARQQYMRIVDQAGKQLQSIQKPSEGWLSVIRKALGMSGAEVAERNERQGAITINQMHKLADAMGGRLVYAIVPDGSVDEMIRTQALQKAEARIRRASAHMALEKQSLSDAQTKQRIEELAEELARDMPPDFWD